MSPMHVPFVCIKNEEGNKGKKERFSKQKLLKGSHQAQNITVLVMFAILF